MGELKSYTSLYSLQFFKASQPSIFSAALRLRGAP